MWSSPYFDEDAPPFTFSTASGDDDGGGGGALPTRFNSGPSSAQQGAVFVGAAAAVTPNNNAIMGRARSYENHINHTPIDSTRRTTAAQHHRSHAQQHAHHDSSLMLNPIGESIVHVNGGGGGGGGGMGVGMGARAGGGTTRDLNIPPASVVEDSLTPPSFAGQYNHPIAAHHTTVHQSGERSASNASSSSNGIGLTRGYDYGDGHSHPHRPQHPQQQEQMAVGPTNNPPHTASSLPPPGPSLTSVAVGPNQKAVEAAAFDAGYRVVEPTSTAAAATAMVVRGGPPPSLGTTAKALHERMQQVLAALSSEESQLLQNQQQQQQQQQDQRHHRQYLHPDNNSAVGQRAVTSGCGGDEDVAPFTSALLQNRCVGGGHATDQPWIGGASTVVGGAYPHQARGCDYQHAHHNPTQQLAAELDAIQRERAERRAQLWRGGDGVTAQHGYGNAVAQPLTLLTTPPSHLDGASGSHVTTFRHIPQRSSPPRRGGGGGVMTTVSPSSLSSSQPQPSQTSPSPSCCPSCGKSFANKPLSVMVNHPSRCAYRKVACLRCGERVTASYVDDHLMRCGGAVR